jgi:hypothetical protein
MSKFQLSIIGIVVIAIVAAMNHPSAKPGGPATPAENEMALTVALQGDSHLRDPDSVQVIRWSHFDCHEPSWHTTVEFRAKNGFGGYSIERAKIDHQGDRSEVQFIR